MVLLNPNMKESHLHHLTLLPLDRLNMHKYSKKCEIFSEVFKPLFNKSPVSAGSKRVKPCNEREASAKAFTVQKRKEGQTCQTAVNEHALLHPAGDPYPERAQN